MLQTEPIACAQMLIRKPVAEVFEAFIDPEITSKFWFSRGDCRLKEGKATTWNWECMVSPPTSRSRPSSRRSVF